MSEAVKLYTEQYIATGFERRELFELLDSSFSIDTCLYPGCFIHCTPSFFFRECAYVDTDKRAVRFFKSSAVRAFIEANSVRDVPMVLRFHHADYDTRIPEPDASFDLILSLYAGFISPPCTRYLKPGGVLVANNSHGDASMATLDSRLRLVGVVHARNNRHSLETDSLDRYMIPKRQLDITANYLRKMQRGIAYTKSAKYYIFERT